MTPEEALEAAAQLCDCRDPNVLLEDQEAMPQQAYWTMLDVLRRLATRIRALKDGE